MADAPHSTRAVPVEHVTIRSTKPFEDVRAKLASLAPRIDDGISTLLRYGEGARNAPIRVLLREDDDGGVAFEYDRPASVFGQFGSDNVDAEAQQLDRDLQALLEAAAV
jgi:hypothetical protein